MKTFLNYFTTISVIVFILALIFGWILNFSAILQATSATPIGILVGRVIGVFLVPIGAVFGWIL